MGKAKREPITATDLELALRDRYQPREWAFFSQVRNGTGYSRSVTRTADALALGLWPSRGMELHGFEIKCYRGDWLREGENPEKAEEIAAYCDRWWVVAAAGIVADGELPPAWGLLELRDGALVTAKEAPLRPDAKPLDRSMIAAVMRSAAKADEAAIAARIYAESERSFGKERDRLEKEIERLRSECREESARASEAEKKLKAISIEGQRHQLEYLKHMAERLLSDVSSLLAPAKEPQP